MPPLRCRPNQVSAKPRNTQDNGRRDRQRALPGRFVLYQLNPTIYTMLHYAIIFLIIAIIAGAFGFFGLMGTAALIAKVLFAVFLLLFIVSLVTGKRPRI